MHKETCTVRSNNDIYNSGFPINVYHTKALPAPPPPPGHSLWGLEPTTRAGQEGISDWASFAVRVSRCPWLQLQCREPRFDPRRQTSGHFVTEMWRHQWHKEWGRLGTVVGKMVCFCDTKLWKTYICFILGLLFSIIMMFAGMLKVKH